MPLKVQQCCLGISANRNAEAVIKTRASPHLQGLCWLAHRLLWSMQLL